MQALWSYTGAGAFAEFEEHIKGRLAPVLFADVVVLDRDLEACSISELASTRVTATFVGGIPVYQS
jgi:predicted amidohydrolase YtcJ